MDDWIGCEVSDVKIEKFLAQGGMGEVWRATDTALNREVAVKVLPSEMAADPERLEVADHKRMAPIPWSKP